MEKIMQMFLFCWMMNAGDASYKKKKLIQYYKPYEIILCKKRVESHIQLFNPFREEHSDTYYNN